MECVANTQQSYLSFKSNDNFRAPLGVYAKLTGEKENSHGFFEMNVYRDGSDDEDAGLRNPSSVEEDYFALLSLRNHAVLVSSEDCSNFNLSNLSSKDFEESKPFLFFAWVVPPAKGDNQTPLKLYVDIDAAEFRNSFTSDHRMFVNVFNFSKMSTFIRYKHNQ